MEETIILLDTNSYSAFISGSKTVSKIVHKASTVLMSSIVLGELYAGFIRGNKSVENINILQNFLSEKEVSYVGVTFQTAQIYGGLVAALAKKGRPIPTNDIWIAASCIENKARLISSDSHFKEIVNIKGTGLNWKT